MVGCGDTVAGKGFYCCNQTIGNKFVANREACCASDPFASSTSCPGSLGAIVPQGYGQTPASPTSFFSKPGCGLNIPVIGGIPCFGVIGLGVALVFMLVLLVGKR
jgi:hypothetical protein